LNLRKNLGKGKEEIQGRFWKEQTMTKTDGLETDGLMRQAEGECVIWKESY